MRRSLRLPLFLLVAAHGLPAAAAAASRLVPSEYPTVAGALAAAAPGDTVLVSPGTYVEDLVLVSGVTLRGAGSAQQVVLQGTGSGSVVRGSGTSAATRLLSLTLQGGIGTLVGGTRMGGGLYLENAQIRMKDVVIRNNQADLGGGLCAENSDVDWIGGELSSNLANLGGGAFFTQGEHHLSGVAASGNQATSGGVAYAVGVDLLTVDACHWAGNTAVTSGGALYADQTALSLSYVRLDGNEAGETGGAVALRTGAIAEFSYCVFYANVASASGASWHARCDGLPGAACVEVLLSHCDVVRNHAPVAAAGAVDGAARAEFRESVIAGNDSPAACLDSRGELRLECSVTAGNGSSPASACPVYESEVTVADPYFCDLDGGQLERCTNSPLLVPPSCGAGPSGALVGGCGACGPTQSESTTWGRLKVRYR